MARIEIHQSLPTHRKSLAAADHLNMEPVHFVGHLISFWLWALNNVQDGNLEGVSSIRIVNEVFGRRPKAVEIYSEFVYIEREEQVVI